MNISDKGIEFLKLWEGIRRRTYLDSAKKLTVGCGHLVLPKDNLKLGDEITIEQVDAFLRQDVKIAKRAVNHLVKVPVTQNQFDSLVSFVFNLGAGKLAGSTLLRKLNKADYEGAAEQFKGWVNSGGHRIVGLVRRREAERQLFLKPCSHI